jgi:hypothetical protein
MKEVTQGNFSAEIPATATAGNRVAYYLEAQGAEEATIGSKGTADDPLVITLKGSGAPSVSSGGDDDDDDDEEGPSWFLALGLGSGAGWTTGSGEVSSDAKVTPGFAPATLGHLAPEVGYFMSDKILLSVQLRMQMITGVTQRYLPMIPENMGECGGNYVCDPAKSAFAALGKVTYLFGEDSFHPYVSAAIGGGQIRHTATFKSISSCGANKTSACVDTILAGPVLVGPGAGFIFNASDNFALMLGANTLLGFPNFTFNIDFNAGAAVEF